MRELVDLDPGRKVDIDDCAAVAEVSSRQLRRLFQEFLGHTPLEVLYMYLIARSLTGLRAGQKIDPLAHEHGFAHAAHYSSRFKAMYGKSPTQMQKAMATNTCVIPDLPFL